MPKAEISWKRVTEDGQKLQVYAHQVGNEWRIFQREKRFDAWQRIEAPPLVDWLELLDALRRSIQRRRWVPKDEALLMRRIRERFPDADLGEPQHPV